MGNRDYKQFGSGEYYHIYNRGNGKQDVFLDAQDFTFFLRRLAQNLFPEKEGMVRSIPLPENSFSLVSYCLMPNHFHLLLRQNTDPQTSKLILRVCTSYAKYFNKKYEKVGHVFQDQFQQIRIQSDEYLLWLSAYIHQNPVVAGLAHEPFQYQWSSYAAFIGTPGMDSLCDTTVILQQFSNVEAYRKFVDDSFTAIRERKDLERFLIDV